MTRVLNHCKAFVLALACLALAGCREPSLLEGLDQQQANEVVALLQRNNIAVDKQENGKLGYSVRSRCNTCTLNACTCRRK